MPNECYELTITGILAGQFVQNVLHVNVGNTGSDPPYEIANDVLDTLNNTVQFWEGWCNALPADYRITSARCRRVLVTGGPTAIWLASQLSQSVGQRSGSIQSCQVNPVIVLLTTIRPNRPGRIFLPGLSETDCDDMIYTSGVLTTFTDLIELLKDSFALDTATYTANFSILRREIDASDDITNGRVSPLIGTQRRRLRPV